MKIIYNLDCIRAPMTGVGYYTQNMVLAMIQQYPELDIIAHRHHHLLSKEETLAICSRFTSDSSSLLPWKKTLITMINRSSMARNLIQWQHNLRHRLTLKNKLQGYIYHEPNFVFMPHSGLKVMTIHDISMFACPEFLPQGRARFLQQQMRRGMQKADALIVSCQFIKNQMIELLQLPEHKIHIIAPGVQAAFMPRSEQETQPYLHFVRSRFEVLRNVRTMDGRASDFCAQKSLPVLQEAKEKELFRREHRMCVSEKPQNANARSATSFSLSYKEFLLCVATLEPRKNLARLIQAYQKLPADLQKIYPLVLVGTKGWLYEELLKIVHDNKSSNILFLRYVDEQTLLHLYSAAKAFIYPSLYEGFGLPVLEAMQSGLPVITSNSSSLPEVCGDAGMLIDPLDISAMTQTMEILLTMQDEAYQTLVQRSLHQAKLFTWNSFAKKLFAVYCSL